MKAKFRKQYSGFGLIGWIVMIPILIIAALIITVGFYEARKTYWDNKVRDMCKKDGGVKVYDTISITNSQYEKLEKIQGSLSIPPQSLAKQENLVFSIMSESVIRDSNPKVRRNEQIVIRQSDGKIIGKIISYDRVGGDFPTIIGHPTHYGCPKSKDIYKDQSKFVVIKGE